MKNSKDTVGNRTRDLSACSAVPQPTVPPPTPVCSMILYKYKQSYVSCNITYELYRLRFLLTMCGR